LMERELSPPRSIKEDSSDRWRSQKDNGGSERWRPAESGDTGSDRWSRRDSISDRFGGAQRRASSRERSPRRLRDRDSRRSGMRNDRMVYIANIPYDVRWMELKDLVREKAGEVQSLSLDTSI
uniref:RRM domain-containing protein n=1 Tax=Gongylonema pulchrum TaxID=637853 RepID=A0A183F1F9_9BILA